MIVIPLSSSYCLELHIGHHQTVAGEIDFLIRIFFSFVDVFYLDIYNVGDSPQICIRHDVWLKYSEVKYIISVGFEIHNSVNVVVLRDYSSKVFLDINFIYFFYIYEESIATRSSSVFSVFSLVYIWLAYLISHFNLIFTSPPACVKKQISSA